MHNLIIQALRLGFEVTDMQFHEDGTISITLNNPLDYRNLIMVKTDVKASLENLAHWMKKYIDSLVEVKIAKIKDLKN